MTLTSFLIIINNEKIKSSKKKFPVLYASWVSCILFWSHNTSYFLAGIFPCLLPLPYISFLPRASSCLFLHHPPLFFLLHSYHLHFHVNTWIKGRNRNEVKCFLLCGQDATSIKVTLMHCWSRSVSTASCFRVLTLKPLGPGQSTLEWGKRGEGLWAGVQPLKSCADPGPASCGELAAFLGLAKRSEAPRLSLPDGLLPWFYSEPQEWEKVGSLLLCCAAPPTSSSWPCHATID